MSATTASAAPVRRRRVVLIALGTLAILTVALIAGRLMVAEWLLTRLLRARGIEVSHATVTRLSLRGGQIRDLSIDRGMFNASEVTAEWTPGGLLRGQLEQIELDGVVLRLDMRESTLFELQRLGRIVINNGRVALATQQGEMVAVFAGSLSADPLGNVAMALQFTWQGAAGRLVGSLDGEARPDGRILGRIGITDGRFRTTRADVHRISGEASFDWREGWPDRLSLRLDSGRFDDGELALEPLAARIELDRGTLSIDAGLRVPDGSLALGLRARVEGLPGAAHLDASASAELAFPLTLPWLSEDHWPSTGLACIEFQANGELPVDWLMNGIGSGGPLSPGEGLAVAIEASATDIDLRNRVERLSGRLGARAGLADSELSIELTAGSAASARTLDRAWLEAHGVPARMARYFQHNPRIQTAGSATLGLAPDLALQELVRSRLHFNARLSGARRKDLLQIELKAEARGHSGKLAATGDLELQPEQLEVDGLLARDLMLRLPFTVAASRSRLDFDLTAPATVKAGSVRVEADHRLGAPLALTIPRGSLRAARHATGPWNWDCDLSLTLPEALLESGASEPLRRARVRDAAVKVVATTGPGQPTRGRIIIENATITLPDHELEIGAVAGTIPFGHRPPHGSGELVILDHARLKHLAEPALFAPVTLSARVLAAGDFLSASGTLVVPGPGAPWSVRAWQRGDGEGAASLDSGIVEFAPGRLQPRDWSSRLTSLTAVRGHARVEVNAIWGGAGNDASARILLDDIALTSAELQATGVSADLELDSLRATHGTRAQCLALTRLDAGTGPPVTDLVASFTIESDPTPTLSIGQARAGFCGAVVATRDVRLVTGPGDSSLTLAVDALDLAELIGWLKVDGLAATGQLDGQVPLYKSAADLIITGGELRARAPGRLSYRSTRAKELLVSGGEPVALMLRALENFHYSSLELRLEHSQSKDTRVRINLLGSNPEVLGGYPFQINIDFTSNTRNLLAALDRSYQLRDRIWLRARE